MPSETLLAFITYAFVTSVTPGPNNTMLLASGLNYGFVRSLPHVLGISIGFAVMVMGVGAGLGRLFEAYPSLYAVLRIVGGAYLVYLAWQIATAAPMGDASTHGRPFGFWKAAGFQWVNSKAWFMAFGAMMGGGAGGGRVDAWPSVRVLEGCGFPMGQSEGVDHGHRGHHGLLARRWRHAGGRGALAAVRARQRTQRDGLGHVRYNPTPLADRPETPSGIQRIHGDNAGAVAVPTSV